MPFQAYRLPSGQIVDVDATAAKGARIIDFTLAGGEIVQAVRLQPTAHEVYAEYGVAPVRSKDELKGFGPGGENW
jgi:hypothetical protein